MNLHGLINFNKNSHFPNPFSTRELQLFNCFQVPHNYVARISNIMASQSDEKPFLKYHPRQIGDEDHVVEQLSFSKDGRWLAFTTEAGDWSAEEAWQTGLGEKQKFDPHYDYDGNYAFTHANSEHEDRGWRAYNGHWMEQHIENLVEVYPHFDRFNFTRSVSNDTRDEAGNKKRNLFKNPYYIYPRTEGALQCFWIGIMLSRYGTRANMIACVGMTGMIHPSALLMTSR